ncbi:MAG TPA: DUF58 domain-containing protein [Methanosarcinales archaeon]|nr:DUF58 domain-containing protein [Methanosarcinales archaeon]
MVFSKKASLILALGFFYSSLGILSTNSALLISGILLIVYIAINWFFYSIREKTLFSSDITVARKFNTDLKLSFTNKKIPVTITVKNNTGRDFEYVEITDYTPDSFEVLGENSRIVALNGKSEYTFTYYAIPKRRGVHKFTGVSVYVADKGNLFYNEKFFQVLNTITVYPSIEEISIDKIRQERRSTLRALGAHKSKQTGIGSDFAGIREYIHGDSFRKIEWKSTSRLNKLMTREFESDIRVPAIIFLDVSATMDTGKIGPTKLDYAIKTAAAFSKFALDSNDPVGLYTFSNKIHTIIKPNLGKKQLYQILHTLARIDPRISSEIDANYYLLIDIIKQYLSKSFPETFVESDWDIDTKVLNFVGEQLKLKESSRIRMQKDYEFAERKLIKYCIESGIELPFQYNGEINKDIGLYNAIKKAIVEEKGSSLFIIISDLIGLETSDRTKDSLKLARLHHHKVMVLSPYTPYFETIETPQKQNKILNKIDLKIDLPSWIKKEKIDLNEITKQLVELKYSKTREEFAKELKGIGIPVLSLSPEDFIVKLLSQLLKMKQQRITVFE